RPSDGANTSVRPSCKCNKPRSVVPIQSPPSRSRSSLFARNCLTTPGSGDGSAFASASRDSPPFQPARSVPSLSSPSACIPSGSPASGTNFGEPGFHLQRPLSTPAQRLPLGSAYKLNAPCPRTPSSPQQCVTPFGIAHSFPRSAVNPLTHTAPS